MAELVPEAATVMDIGRRCRQEDAVIADFSQGARLGLAVLSDGMGGHEDGDLASRVIAGEMFGELFFSGAQPDALMRDAPVLFRSALDVANRRLRAHAKDGFLGATSGGTLVSLAVVQGALHWISVGDSPLYLYRDKTLQRLNAIHSMAPQIDLMVREGMMDPEEGREHPHRNCLTSAVTGADIQAIDCPLAAFPLEAGDIVILASDGLNTLTDSRIRAVIRRNRHKGSQHLAHALMKAVREADAPNQDNVSIVVITLRNADVELPGILSAAAQDMSVAVNEVVLRTTSGLRQLLKPKARQARP